MQTQKLTMSGLCEIPQMNSSAENLRHYFDLDPFPIQQHQQTNTQEREEETDKMSQNELDADVIYHYRGLGQALGILSSTLKKHSVEIKRREKVESDLRAENKALTAQLKEVEKKLAIVNTENKEIQKRAEENLQQAKIEEKNLRNNCVELTKQLTCFKSKLEKRQQFFEMLQKEEVDKKRIEELNLEGAELKLIERIEEREKYFEDLRKKLTEASNKINELEESLELQALILNGQLEAKNKEVLEYKNKWEELKGQFDNAKVKNSELESEIENFERKSQANEVALKELKIERNNLEIEKSETIKKFSLVSQELKHEIKANQVKKTELERKMKEISDLKKEKKELQEYIDEVKEWIAQKPQKRRKRSVSSMYYSGKGNSPELHSVTVVADEESENSAASGKAELPETIDITH